MDGSGSALERHLQVHGLEHCFPYFPHDMPVKAFGHLTEDLLKDKYGVKCPATRTALLRLARHRCSNSSSIGGSSSSSDCRMIAAANRASAASRLSVSSSGSLSCSVPSAAGPAPPSAGCFGSGTGGTSGSGSLSATTAVLRPLSPIKRGRLTNSEDSPSPPGPPTVLSRRLLQRTVSEDVRHRKKRPLSVSLSQSQHQLQGSNLGLSGHYLSASCASSIGSYGSETSNLLRMRNSALGHSEPNLSSTTRELSSSRKSSAGGRTTPVKKAIGMTASQRCLSPQGLLSPTDSPKVHSPFLPNLFSFASNAKKHDHRRWSLASLASSSGYGPSPYGTDCSESLTSSHERLHHTNSGPPAVDVAATSPSASNTDSVTSGLLRSKESCSEEAGGSTPSEGKELASIDSLDLALPRPRSRSLSSPMKLSETFMLNSLYRERFPKAVQQMEENLQHFIDENGGVSSSVESDSPASIAADPSDSLVCSDGSLRFACRQVVALARDCLDQSRAQLLTTTYFHGLDQNLELLVVAAKSGSLRSADVVRRVTRRLQMITSRTARLLECLTFDPDEFYCLLEQTEGEAKKKICAADIPQYVIGKLGLNRFPDTSDADPCLSSASEGEKSDHEDQLDVKQQLRASLPTMDDFIHIKLISNGAYGAVHLVRHKETKQKFAMKQILKSNLVLRNQVEQVFAERDILAFVDNPFVVCLYCTFETRTHLCLVLEFVEGGDCAALLKNNGPLPLDLARLYFAETVLALEYLHSYGIVHRDLKPDNLLITTFGHIKLTDFGLSKMGIMNLATNLYEGMLDKESKQFNDMQIFGTPEYIAPEVILRQGYGKPVDWWSMGIILYEFLVGCVPFFGDTPEELFSHVLSEGIEWPEEKEYCPPPDAQNLICALLERDPMDRLGTGGAQEVKEHALFEDLDWDGVLRQKAEFVPTLKGDEDTSYFDSRTDRYHHEVEDYSNDDEDDSLFHSFSSCSPRYSRVYELFEENRERSKDDASVGSSSSSRRQSSALSTPSLLERQGSGCGGGGGAAGSASDLSESADSSPRSLPLPDALSLAPVGAAGMSLSKQAFRSVEPCDITVPSSAEVPLLDARPKLASRQVQRSDPSAATVDQSTTTAAVAAPAAVRLSAAQQLGDGSTDMRSCGDSSTVVVQPAIAAATDRHLSKLLVHSIHQPVADSSQAQSGILMPYEQPVSDRRRDSLFEHEHNRSSCLPTGVASATSSGAESSHSGVLLAITGDNGLMASGVVPSVGDAGCASGSAFCLKHEELTKNSSDADDTKVKERSLRAATSPVSPLEPIKASVEIPEARSSADRGLVARQLSLVIPSHEDFSVSPAPTSPVSSMGSRESSPTRDYIFSSLAKIPIMIRKGLRGFGFTLRAIRVFLGDREKSLYTMQHLVVDVDRKGPAWEAGLRAGHIITHVNNEPVEGLNHTQVVAHILSKSSKVLLRALPLEETSIRTTTGQRGSKPPSADAGSLARGRALRKSVVGRSSSNGEKACVGGAPSVASAPSPIATPTRRQRHRSSSSLFKKLSKRNAEQSMVHTTLTASSSSPPPPPSSAAAQHAVLSRAVSPRLQQSTLAAAAGAVQGQTPPLPVMAVAAVPAAAAAAAAAVEHSAAASTLPQSSVVAAVGVASASPGGSVSSRPSTLADLKSKLQPQLKSPNRRKSIHNIPLSPLARPSASSSPLALSPTSAVHCSAGSAVTAAAHVPNASPGGGSSSSIGASGTGAAAAGNSSTNNSSGSSGGAASGVNSAAGTSNAGVGGGRTPVATGQHYHLVYRHSSPSQVTRPSPATTHKHRSLIESATVAAVPSCGGCAESEQQQQRRSTSSDDARGPAAAGSSRAASPATAASARPAPDVGDDSGGHDKQLVKRTSRWQDKRNLGDSF